MAGERVIFSNSSGTLMKPVHKWLQFFEAVNVYCSLIELLLLPMRAG
jgi:hypothetical protein